MTRIAVSLCVWVGVVAAEPDLAAIAKTMEAREAASRPFFIDYEIRDEREKGTFWLNTFTGWHYEDEKTLIRRLRVFLHKVATGDLYDQANYTKWERVAFMGRGMVPVNIQKPIARDARGWRGTRSPQLRPMDDGMFTPSQFGLVFAGVPVSAYVRSKTAKVDGRERVGEFDCLRVSLSWGDLDPALPLVLWLSEEHDYYPVRIVQYVRKSKSAKYVAPETDYEYAGLKYVPRSEYRVDRLERAGEGWLPVEGSAPVLFFDSPGMITYKALRSVHGHLAPSRIDMAGVTRAEVLDRPSGHTYIIGSRDGGVPKKASQFLVPTGVQRAVGLQIAPVPKGRSWAQYGVALTAVAAALIWFLVWWRKQARANRAGGTGSRAQPRG